MMSRAHVVLALALLATAACGAGDPGVAEECRTMAPALAATQSAAAGAPVVAPDDYYARAARLWLAERHLQVLAAALAGEQALGDPRMADALGALEAEIAATRADIDGQRQAAVAAGYADLGNDGGARRALTAYVMRDLATRAGHLASSCAHDRASLEAGEVANFVYAADTARTDVAGGAHDVVLYSTAERLAGGATP